MKELFVYSEGVGGAAEEGLTLEKVVLSHDCFSLWSERLEEGVLFPDFLKLEENP